MNGKLARIGVVLAAVCVLLGAMACKNINIPGMVAGRVLGDNEMPMAFTSCTLVNVATGEEAAVETTNEAGNFTFKDVTPGKYNIKISGIGGAEYNSDCKEFKLPPGKTLNIDIHIIK
jgi:hypothetical protein